MDIKKVLVLLITLVIYTNYENYFKEDVQKLHRQVSTLKTNIAREEQIQKDKHTKESLLVDYDKVVFNAKSYSYSKAMGEMQNQITDAAKDVCTIDLVKWAQVPSTKEWYDKLRMNVSVSCKAKELYTFTNRLKEKSTIYKIENFRITKNRREELLNINLQLVGFRTLK